MTTKVIEGKSFTFKCDKERVKAKLEVFDEETAIILLRFQGGPVE